ncbi:MAG: HEAT repeat domain-containing protein [Planctomycetota bacterium]
MLPSLALALAPVLAAPAPVAAAPPVPPVPVQEEEEKKKADKRPEIKEALKALKGHVSKRGAEDAQAIAILDELLVEFPESGPKDRKDIVKGINGCLKVKRKPTKEGLIDNKLYIAAANSLARMGPESVKDLSGWIDHKSFLKDSDTRRALIIALGMTKDDKAVGPLVDLLSNHDAQVQAATAEALGQFDHLKQKERKVIFKKMLDVITQVKNAIDVDQVDPIERDRYDTIAAPMLTTLQILSGHDARDPLVFRRWWNDNKKKNWDKGRDS